MPKNGLLIQYDYCIGCHACEVACKQEHNFPVGKWGIKVLELQLLDARPYLVYIPFPTMLCDLCGKRVKSGQQPTCVQHCNSACIEFGPIEKLTKQMQKKTKTVLWAP